MKTRKTILLFAAILALLVPCGQASIDGMISYWKLDEPSGDIVLDSVGNNHGIIVNDPQRVAGIVGGAVSFDGIWDGSGPGYRDCIRVDSPIDIPIGNSPWSLSMWIMIDEYVVLFDRAGFIFDRGDRTGIFRGMHRLAVGWHGGGPRNHLWNCFWGVPWDYDTEIVLDLDIWYHITNTYDGDVARIYINGIESWSKDIDEPLDVRSSDIFLGGSGAHLSACKIDEVAIHDRPLIPEEIWQNYVNGLNGIGYLDIEVGIDIKPGSYPNSLNTDGHGIIPVAILGSADFDVSQIDTSSLSFAGLAVRVKGQGQPQCSVEDVSGDFSGGPQGAPDGCPDLVCHFVDNPDNWSAGEAKAVLTGNLIDGKPFKGSDEITIVPPNQ